MLTAVTALARLSATLAATLTTTTTTTTTTVSSTMRLRTRTARPSRALVLPSTTRDGRRDDFKKMPFTWEIFQAPENAGSR